MKKGSLKDVDALASVLAAVDGLEPGQQAWVFAAAMSRLGLPTAAAILRPNLGVAAPQNLAGTSGTTPTPKEFMRQRNPQSDVQRVACLSYYLTQYRDQRHFKTKDLSKLNVEAAGGTIGNLSQAVNNATKQSHYLAPAGAGNKQITAHGEEVVGALPDQAAVKALDTKRPRKRKASKRKAKPKAK
jgi:hypothetical protein